MAGDQQEVIIVGAGHSGLAMSYSLTKRAIPHLVLDRGGVGERWRSERWDALTLLTPNWMTQLPGFHYNGDDPDGFVTRDEYRQYLLDYAQSFNAPVREGTEVLAVEKTPDGFALDTSAGWINAENVVVATGAFQKPSIPPFSTGLPKGVLQLHTSGYRNEAGLPAGAILVVGAGNSGMQIAEDLARSGRRVYLSVGRRRPAPRRYRGRDILGWFIDMGLLERRPVDLPSPEIIRLPPPGLTGVDHGHDINLHTLAGLGVTLVGRVTDIQDGALTLAPGLLDTVAKEQETYADFCSQVDAYIASRGIEAPPGEPPALPTTSADRFNTADRFDVAAAGISTVIWATGFHYDWDWMKLPAFDDSGAPLHEGGVSIIPGLYFVGLAWLTRYKSFFIYGVGEDADRLAGYIAERRP